MATRVVFFGLRQSVALGRLDEEKDGERSGIEWRSHYWSDEFEGVAHETGGRCLLLCRTLDLALGPR
jgi:hypothetical protein